ncbi:MAG: hypothetical protein GKC10_00415 [Methanosarcinales archaeon]|nr:hypothetical protein [Methanosarcinales archaeon]
MPFRDPLALLGLLGTIPLIILYLIRPKPREVPFSSLMFLVEGKPERSAALSRLITDPLFWIQLIVLCSLATAAAGPYTVERGDPGSHLVVVLDVSASMEQSFSAALNTASDYMGRYDRISIVLAESIPAVALREGSPAEAQDRLSRLSTRDLSADLAGAMTMASTLLGPEGGDILVISDFISWRGEDPDSTRKLIESDGVQVAFRTVGQGGDNLGIVGGWMVPSISGLNYSCRIHNYGSPAQVPITVKGPGGSSTTTAFIGSDQDYYFSFDASPGTSTVTLEVGDAVSADNVAYIYAPPRTPRDVLYLGEEGPALAALNSIADLRVSQSGSYGEYDLVVVSRNASADGGLNRYIDGGGNVVFVAYSGNESPEYLPVKVQGSSDAQATLWARNPGFAGDIHFEEIGVYSYLEAAPRRHSVTMVEVNGAPALSYWNLGRGRVIYDGLEGGMTDFYQRPEYPIFWYSMINWLTDVPEPSQSNRNTGELIPLGEPTSVETPDGSVTTATLLLDRAGIYTFRGQTVAASLYDPLESDLRGSHSFAGGDFVSRSGMEKIVEKEQARWLIALAALMILLELFIVWRRREV